MRCFSVAIEGRVLFFARWATLIDLTPQTVAPLLATSSALAWMLTRGGWPPMRRTEERWRDLWSVGSVPRDENLPSEW